MDGSKPKTIFFLPELISPIGIREFLRLEGIGKYTFHNQSKLPKEVF